MENRTRPCLLHPSQPLVDPVIVVLWAGEGDYLLLYIIGAVGVLLASLVARNMVLSGKRSLAVQDLADLLNKDEACHAQGTAQSMLAIAISEGRDVKRDSAAIEAIAALKWRISVLEAKPITIEEKGALRTSLAARVTKLRLAGTKNPRRARELESVLFPDGFKNYDDEAVNFEHASQILWKMEQAAEASSGRALSKIVREG